jgi:hypothetical protein
MPDITDLLHGAAPDPGSYDEDDVRRRVQRRHRNRRVVAGVTVALVAIAATGIALAARDTDEDVAVTSRPSTSTSMTSTSVPTTDTSAVPNGAGYAAVVIVDGEVFAGGNGFVARGDGSDRIDVPGQVVSLVAGVDDGLVWAHGDGWVAAIDVISASHPAETSTPLQLVGTWHGGAVGDIVALPSREVAISLPGSNEVAIAKTSAIAELEEVWRISVGAGPRDLVRTTGGDVWVASGDGISELDVGAQGVKRTEQWSGPLLAPSLSGGIWTVDGDRVIDLHPENLDAGVSVAEGTRYQARATAVTETPYGLYVAGPDGLTRQDPDHADPEVIDRDQPSALAADGGQIVYVVDGAIRTAQAHGGGSQVTTSSG